MKQEYYFGNAKWIGASERTKDTFSVIRGHFFIKEKGKATLNILGLGFFKCYINGALINPDTFLPLSSDFEGSCDPIDEKLSGHRIYVPTFDITDLIKEGDNVIAIHFGGGWYTFRDRVFGLPKAIYRISVDNNKNDEFVSDENCRVSSSYIKEYDFTICEKHDYTSFRDCLAADFDDSEWNNAVLTEVLETEYCTSDCPADALIEELELKLVKAFPSGTVYDCSENTTGYPVIEITAPYGEAVEVWFSEEITDDGDLEEEHVHGQRFTIVSDGKNRIVQPDFVWFGFRYLKLKGEASLKCVKVIHAEIPVTSTFRSDNETLNWTYKTFIHTMLCNMHTGHPSDCPHLERRGYTGDGQLTCHAALTVLGARSFYEKWLQDIGDCQDIISGHIQYTAPYLRSGGGPGGWGCAIVEVPYQLYRHYGDKTVLEKYYNNMRRYIDYLEAHSVGNLVVSDKKGEWCLGDWCGPVILYPDKDITSHNQQVMLPAPMVNNYFMIKSLKTMCKIAEIIGKIDDIAEYEEKILIRKRTTQAAYFNTFDDNFVMNVQGANAFAVDIGLGNEKTYENLVKYYTKLGYYDTGIFATDIVTRVLFEKGNGDLAAQLLVNDGCQGFEHWRRNGATTFHEYWDSDRSRSHNHPMFGAAVAYFFEHLLGIGQRENTVGYTSLVIEPKGYNKFGEMEGSILTSDGRVSVGYTHKNNKVEFRITIPEKTKAVFKNGDVITELHSGENIVEI